MAFNLIIPPPKASNRCIKISTVSMRGGPFRLQISIPSAQFELLFKKAERFDLLNGDGPDAGKLQIRINETGHFKPTFMKHTVLFRLPADLEGTPQIALAADNPDRRELAGGGIVLTLPAWMEKGRWQEIAKARTQVARERDVAKQVNGNGR